ncbi:MAG: 4Fe-4S cluster-binding domain-containing protein [bacterium]
MKKIMLPRPISGGLLLSYKCTAECRHCMYGCSPKWRGNWISQEDLRKILRGLAGKIKPSPWGPQTVSLNYGLHFTGGEPFLNFELLLKAVEIAHELAIPSTFVETNCYWCTSDEVTRQKLKLLKEKDLGGILISVNPFFLEYVPFQRTERGIRIGQEVFGRNLMVYQLEYYRQFKRLGIKGRISLEGYLKLAKKENLTRNVELFFMGRAAYKLRGFYSKYPADSFLNQPCRPAFLRSWHNHWDNYGNYLPGYCGGISLGDCRNLDRLLKEGIDLEEHPVLRFLTTQDLKGLFQFAQDFGYQESAEGYLSNCHLCLDLRKHLVSKKEFEELRPKEFYWHLE